MKKDVLILTASTGYGHNQVAESLKFELELNNCVVNIIEPFREVSKSLDLLVSGGYRVLATKMPKMYGKIYKASNSQIGGRSVGKLSVRALEEKLEELNLTYRPDLIISTHPLLVKAVCSIKLNGHYQGPFISIITDYLPHESYINRLVDAYIVGSQYTKKKTVQKGIDINRVHVHGIPIKREFSQYSRQIQKDRKFTVLLMGGSMGVNGVKKVFKELIEIDSDIRITVICGNNETLRKSLSQKNEGYQSKKDITILGFTDKISHFMEMSDVVITKPGGLTVAESFAKNIPMIIPYYIPGQEKENADMLFEVGAALRVDHKKDLNKTVERLIKNPEILEQMKRNMLNVSSEHSLDSTINMCLKLLNQGDHL